PKGDFLQLAEGVMIPIASAESRPAQAARGPVWFQRMDRNGDGELSLREWLGSKEDFRRIDTNGDGIISLEEAERADAQLRKQRDGAEGRGQKDHDAAKLSPHNQQ